MRSWHSWGPSRLRNRPVNKPHTRVCLSPWGPARGQMWLKWVKRKEGISQVAGVPFQLKCLTSCYRVLSKEVKHLCWVNISGLGWVRVVEAGKLDRQLLTSSKGDWWWIGQQWKHWKGEKRLDSGHIWQLGCGCDSCPASPEGRWGHLILNVGSCGISRRRWATPGRKGACPPCHLLPLPCWLTFLCNADSHLGCCHLDHPKKVTI